MKIVISNAIKSDSTKIKNCINELSKNIKQLQNLVNDVPKAWQGQDATSFINKYKEALTKLKKYESSFNDYYLFLSKVHVIFNALDEAYDKTIDTN